ncbi:MAG: hypothetical protein ACXWPI_01200 [Ktedonobacterales bacterium]
MSELDLKISETEKAKTEEFDDNSVVTVAHGYGRVPSSEVRLMDKVEFRGGVARHVPYAIAKKWKSVPYLGKSIVILNEDATEAEIAKACNIQPMALPKFAAMFSAMNIDEIAAELGPLRAREIGLRLLDLANPRVTKDAQGKFRSNKNPNAD